LAATRSSAEPAAIPAGGAKVRQEKKLEKPEARSNKKDLATLQSILGQLQRAKKTQNAAALKKVDARLNEYLGKKLAGDKQAVKADAAEAQHDVKAGEKDVAVEQAGLEQQRRISKDLEGLSGKTDAQSIESRESLIKVLMGLAGSEVRQGGKELRQDKQEVRDGVRATAAKAAKATK
jgi:hypothetical protein